MAVVVVRRKIVRVYPREVRLLPTLGLPGSSALLLSFTVVAGCQANRVGRLCCASPIIASVVGLTLPLSLFPALSASAVAKFKKTT